MTPDQRLKLTQGIAFGVFFQYLGYFIKDVSVKHAPTYFGGIVCMVMGFIIFAWGCSHLVAAKRLPKWANLIGLLSLVGLVILWRWNPPGQEAHKPAR
jgi:fucose permease